MRSRGQVASDMMAGKGFLPVGSKDFGTVFADPWSGFQMKMGGVTGQPCPAMVTCRHSGVRYRDVELQVGFRDQGVWSSRRSVVSSKDLVVVKRYGISG